MERNEAVALLQKIGGDIAKELGFGKCDVGEDRQKGIWGEKMTAYLEGKYGECSAKIVWHGGEPEKKKVEFNFRFATPRLEIRNGNAYASIEVSNYDYETKTYTLPEFEICESLVQMPDRGGFEMLELLTTKWKEATNKEKYLEEKSKRLVAEIMKMLPDEPRSGVKYDPGFWSDGERILCPSEMESQCVADFLEDVTSEYGKADLTTGYYDPKDDEQSGETDKYTGFHYIEING